MKNLKRVLALVTVFAMLLSVSAFAHVWQYDDVIDSWTEEESATNYGAIDLTDQAGNAVIHDSDSAAEYNWNWADTVQKAITDSQSDTTFNTAVTAAGTVEETGEAVLDEKDVTIVMTDDETASNYISVTSTVTLDLNGETLDYKGGVNTLLYANGGNLTIKDSSEAGTGKVAITENTHSNGYGVLVANNGSVTVDSGSIEGKTRGISANSGTEVTVNGGAVSGTTYGVYNAGTTSINGGMVSGTYGVVNAGIANVKGGTVSGSESNSKSIGIYNNGGTTTVESGTVSGEKYGVYSAGGTVNVSGGEVNSKDSGIYSQWNKTNTINLSGGTVNAGTLNEDGVLVNGYGISVFDNDTLNMTGGTVNAGYFAVCNNGSDAAASTMNITGGTLNSDGTAIYHPGPGMLNISGDAYIEGVTGIEIRAGELTVNGGTIVATGDPYAEHSNNNGSTTAGSGIAVAQHTTKKDITVNVNNANISGIYAVSVSNPENNGSENVGDVTVNINGGTYSGAFVEFDTRNDTTTMINGLTTPTRNGYNFIGWTDAAGNAIAFPYDVTDTALTLVAQWEAIPEPEPVYEDTSDDDDTTSAPVTIEEEATPLAALPEEFTFEDVATLAVDLGLAETVETYEPATIAAAEDVASAVAALTASDENADAAAILAEAGINESDEVSREQFATVIFALAEAQGVDITARADLAEQFSDADAVSAFAQEALEWAVSVGIYQGDDEGNLNPTKTLTYEQLVLIVSRYLALISTQ